jgi:hypothetical protein
MRAAKSLNNLIRPQQQRLRNRQAEGFGGLEIDHELVCGRRLDRQVGGLRASQEF